jgi:ferredoxin-NADP reductase
VKNSHHKAYLRNVRYTNDRTKHFEFETRNGNAFEYDPGQFISMEVEIGGERCIRSYSIASSPHHDNRFDLCLNIIPRGLVSPWLFHLRPGESIEFSGPHGLFTLRQPVDPVSAFIATGTGIAPIRAMLQYLYQEPQPAEVWLIFGVRKEGDILYREEFERMASENPGFHFIPTLSRPESGWSGHSGYVQRQIARYLQRKEGLHAYVCGLRRMVDDVRQQLETMGYDPAALSYERYD